MRVRACTYVLITFCLILGLNAWNLMEPLESFINRNDEIEELHDLLSIKGVVVTGPVGVGKSEIARKYCEHFAKNYERIIWVNGENLEGNLFDLLKDLNILLPDSLQNTAGILNVMPEVYQKLSNEPTLIIFDDIENDEALFKYLPSTPQASIKILITSQEAFWPSEILKYPLDALKIVNAFTYIVYNIYDDGSFKKDDIKYFLENVVRRHPLLCQLSAAYIKKHQITVQEYEQLLKTGVNQLTNPTPPSKDSKYSEPINAAINIAIQALADSNSVSELQLLNTLSFLDVNKMENKLLKHFKDDGGGDPVELLSNLEEYSLIVSRSPVADNCESSYSMYGFIKKILQSNIEETEIINCICQLSQMVTDSMEDQHPALHGKEWMRHLVPLIKKYSSNDEVMEILKVHKIELRLALENEGKYKTANEICSFFFLHELKYEFKAGESFMSKSKFNRALEVFEDVLKNQSDHLGENHLKTLDTMYNVGLCFMEQSQCDRALDIFLELEKKLKENFGETHTKTLATKKAIRECKRRSWHLCEDE